MQALRQRSHYMSQLNKSLIGRLVIVAGWVEDIRDIGRLVFIVIRDTTGSAQAIARGESVGIAKELSRQSSVVVRGILKESDARNFPFEISIQDISVQARASNSLPIDATGRISSSIDKRIDSRALDLRNPSVSTIFKIRALASSSIRENLSREGYLEVNTPKIIGTASEGGANLFSFDYFKKKAYLAQSPQLYKEQLIVALDRVFEIGPYFRAEKSHTVRHLSEFTSVDTEAAFVDYIYSMSNLEELVRKVVSVIADKFRNSVSIEENPILSSKHVEPITKITYKQCLEYLSNKGEKIEFGEDLTDSSLRVLGEKHDGFYFITDWPTNLKPFYIQEKNNNPELSESFDLQYGYLELASGGTRLHEKDHLRSRLEKKGLRPQDFAEHLKAFDWGIPPHAGWGLGFDRLIMTLTNFQNVREVVLFPRDVDRLVP
jgi:nondiscriminating aspartyl-tRNA synthetase